MQYVRRLPDRATYTGNFVDSSVFISPNVKLTEI